jgi:hypothetical protein
LLLLLLSATCVAAHGNQQATIRLVLMLARARCIGLAK